MYCYVVEIFPLKPVSLSLNILIELYKNTNSLFHTIFIMFINFIIVKVISQFPILPQFHMCSYLLQLPLHSPLLPQDPHVLNFRGNIPNGQEYIFIGCPSKWGNPFTVEMYGRSQAIFLYEQHLTSSSLINQVCQLKDKLLICFCTPKPCHGDVLAKYIYKNLQLFGPSSTLFPPSPPLLLFD